MVPLVYVPLGSVEPEEVASVINGIRVRFRVLEGWMSACIAGRAPFSCWDGGIIMPVRDGAGGVEMFCERAKGC